MRLIALLLVALALVGCATAPDAAPASGLTPSPQVEPEVPTPATTAEAPTTSLTPAPEQAIETAASEHATPTTAPEPAGPATVEWELNETAIWVPLGNRTKLVLLWVWNASDAVQIRTQDFRLTAGDNILLPTEATIQPYAFHRDAWGDYVVDDEDGAMKRFTNITFGQGVLARVVLVFEDPRAPEPTSLMWIGHGEITLPASGTYRGDRYLGA